MYIANWFVFSIGVLEISATCIYLMKGDTKLALLMFFYGLSSFVLCTIRSM